MSPAIMNSVPGSILSIFLILVISYFIMFTFLSGWAYTFMILRFGSTFIMLI